MSATFLEGEPYWVEVTTPDVPATAKLYEQLFGWTTQDLGPESGHYTMVSQRGKLIAAISPCQEPATPWWNVYFKVADARAAAAASEAAGGRLIKPPMDVFEECTIAVCQAPDGAIFGISQPKNHKGAQLWDADGAPATVTLLAESHDAFDFYKAVFGWTRGESAMEAGLIALGAQQPFGEMHVMDPVQRPEGARPSWLTVFKSDDVDGLAARAAGLGCAVPVGPLDLPGVGRTAFIVDPNGAGFSIVGA